MRQAAVNEMEFVQRVALEMRRRPAWVEDIDDTPTRLPPADCGEASSHRAAGGRLPHNDLGVSERRSVALQADWRIGLKEVAGLYRRQYRMAAA